MKLQVLTIWMGKNLKHANFDYGDILSARTVKAFESIAAFKGSNFKATKNFAVAAVNVNGALQVQEDTSNEYIHYLFLTDVPKHIKLAILAKLRTRVFNALRVDAEIIEKPNAVFALDDELLQQIACNASTTIEFQYLVVTNKTIKVAA